MSKVRINDLARELKVKSRSILDALTAVGVTEPKTHSSSIKADEAEKLRDYFNDQRSISTDSRRNRVKKQRPSSTDSRRNRVKKQCSECGITVIHMERHLRKNHPVAFGQLVRMRIPRGAKQVLTADAIGGTQSNAPTPAKAIWRSRRPCPNCGKLLTQMALDIHIEGCGRYMPGIDDHLSGVELPFEILSPGSFDFRRHLEMQVHSDSISDRFFPIYEWVRLEEIERIGGKMTHYGKKAWLGYCVYEFSNSTRVVLESPVKGNATYVFSSDWKKMIHLHKADIRNEYQGNYVRVFHTGDYWLRRVDRAVRKGR